MSKKASGRSLLMLEIVILLVFFVIAIVICVSLFVSASSKNHKANDLNNASLKAVTIADTVKACGNDLEQAKDQLQADSEFNIYYDAQWNSEGQRVYKAAVDYEIKNSLLEATIRFYRIGESKPIYSLNIKEFLQEDM